MKRFILGLCCGICLSLGSAAYASESIQSLLVNVNFLFNGIKKEISSEYSVFNYQGHIYVPIRFVAESMGSTVDYEDSSHRISIKQSSAKFDKNLANPIPFVYYERNYEGGTVWWQDIPLVQGSGC